MATQFTLDKQYEGVSALSSQTPISRPRTLPAADGICDISCESHDGSGIVTFNPQSLAEGQKEMGNLDTANLKWVLG